MRQKMGQVTNGLLVLLSCLLLVGCAGRQSFKSGAVSTPDGGPLAKIKADESFTFVVIGDSRTGISIFKQQIDEINLLDPDFVINSGDLIDGGPGEAAEIEAMWDEFDEIVTRFQVPLVMVCGNHDIWSQLSRAIYERRYGRTYFSFDHKGAHFVVLDTEVLDEQNTPVDRIAGKQLEWLKDDLAANVDKSPTFVFLHKPFWSYEQKTPWRGEQVEESVVAHWMKNVHPLLVEYGVDAVFGGHWHAYTKYPSIDGIDYYVSGGGGAGLDENNEAGGEFYHYCPVTVRNGQFKVAVIKPGSVKPDTIVVASTGAPIKTKMRAIEVSSAGSKPFELRLYNSSNKPAKVTIKHADKRNPHYKTEPQSQTISMKPSEERQVNFDISLDDMQHIYPCPQFTLKAEGINDEPFESTIDAPVKHFETMPCYKPATTIKIDGLLDEAVWTNNMLPSTFRTPDTVSMAKFGTQVSTAYDEKNLYVAFRCHEPNMAGLVAKGKFRDSAVWEDDSVEILLDTNRDGKTYYQFIFNANAIVRDSLGLDSTWNGQHTAKAAREPNAWTLEVAISWKTLGLPAPQPGDKIGAEFTRSRAQSPSEVTQWSPTYGGNRIPAEFGTLIIK